MQKVYVLTGTEFEDLNSPESPFQGKCLSEYTKTDSGEWIRIMRDGNGKPMLGYLAKEITPEEADKWSNRIQKAREMEDIGGYLDSDGHWFPGQLPNSVLLKSAYDSRRARAENGFYRTQAQTLIDKLADSINEQGATRSEEYEERYQEAKRFKASPDTDATFPFLDAMKYKGMDLESGADVVIEKYEAAKAKLVSVANLRMKKNLLTRDIPLSEKRAVYQEIITGLKALKG